LLTPGQCVFEHIFPRLLGRGEQDVWKPFSTWRLRRREVVFSPVCAFCESPLDRSLARVASHGFPSQSDHLMMNPTILFIPVSRLSNDLLQRAFFFFPDMSSSRPDPADSFFSQCLYRNVFRPRRIPTHVPLPPPPHLFQSTCVTRGRDSVSDDTIWPNLIEKGRASRSTPGGLFGVSGGFLASPLRRFFWKVLAKGCRISPKIPPFCRTPSASRSLPMCSCSSLRIPPFSSTGPLLGSMRCYATRFRIPRFPVGSPVIPASTSPLSAEQDFAILVTSFFSFVASIMGADLHSQISY